MSGEPEGNIGARDQSQVRLGHCGVVDPRHAWKLHVREPRDPVAIRSQYGADRWEKAMSYKTHMNGDRESSGGIVPAKRSNAGQGGPKEIVEGRLLAKEKVYLSIPAPDIEPDQWANTWLVDCAKRHRLRSADPRWEPCALGALARICAGGGQQ